MRNVLLRALVWVRRPCFLLAALFLSATVWLGCLPATVAVAQATMGDGSSLGDASAARARAQQFLAGRASRADNRSRQPISAAEAMERAREVKAAASLVPARRAQASALARTANLTAAWQPLGPMAVQSVSYGPISGRITAIAVDPNDPSGNTVYLGTTGGGVWKSTSAAGPLGSMSFAPLTDTLPVFSANTGATTTASLSIGAVAVQPSPNGVVLAGTGDPNDATDSYYGEGLLRSADGGQTWTLIIGSQDGANGSHSFAGLATAGLAWSTAAPNLIVAAMTVSAEGSIVGQLTRLRCRGSMTRPTPV